jgi:hypothetical protein
MKIMKLIKWILNQSERRIAIGMLFINLVGVAWFLYADRRMPLLDRVPFYMSGAYFGLLFFFWMAILLRDSFKKMHRNVMAKALAYWFHEHVKQLKVFVKEKEDDPNETEQSVEIFTKEDVLTMFKKIGYVPDFEGLEGELRNLSTLHKQD